MVSRQKVTSFWREIIVIGGSRERRAKRSDAPHHRDQIGTSSLLLVKFKSSSLLAVETSSLLLLGSLTLLAVGTSSLLAAGLSRFLVLGASSLLADKETNSGEQGKQKYSTIK